MKVKKFRIKPRLGIAARNLRVKMGLKQLPQELEESLAAESESLIPQLSPIAFYQTWNGEKIPARFIEALGEQGLKNAVAVSALVASIGSAPEDQISELLMSGETVRSQVITALSDEAVIQSFNFIYKLLSDDAKSDDCQTSDPLFLEQNKELLVETLEILDAKSENIELDSASHLNPRFTRVALVGWVPSSRKKRLVSTAKKKSR